MRSSFVFRNTVFVSKDTGWPVGLQLFVVRVATVVMESRHANVRVKVELYCKRKPVGKKSVTKV